MRTQLDLITGEITGEITTGRAGTRRPRRWLTGAVVAALGATGVVGAFDSASNTVGAACTNPAADIVVIPGQDIAARAASAPEGTRFRLAPGVHRTGSVRPKANQSFLGSVDSTCRRVSTLDGSRVLPTWQSSGGRWSAAAPTPALPIGSTPCERGFPRCAYPQDLFIDDQVQRHVGTVAEVSAGRWFYDYRNRRIVTGTNPIGRRAELGVQPYAIHSSRAAGVTVSGLMIQKFANASQSGAVGGTGSGPSWKIVDNELRWNHGAGATAGPRTLLSGNFAHHNGQLGLKARGDAARVVGNLVERNNYSMVGRGYEAGGVKVSAADIVISGNCVANNEGAGLWADVRSRRTVFSGNTVFGSWAQGIFFEISDGAVVVQNRVGRNGTRNDWLYGAQIMIATSSNARVSGNVVEVGSVGNGITVIWQNRGADHVAVDNVVAGNDVTYLERRGLSGLGTDFAGGATIYRRNTFRDNTYHAPNVATSHFAGSMGNGTLSQMKSSGQDARSTMDTNVRPAAWNCDALRRTVGR